MDEHGRTFLPRSQPTSHPARQFRSVAELVDTINLYLAQHNLEPKRYVWHADGQEVLNKIHRAWEAATNRPTAARGGRAGPDLRILPDVGRQEFQSGALRPAPRIRRHLFPRFRGKLQGLYRRFVSDGD